jgi:DNA polymerase
MPVQRSVSARHSAGDASPFVPATSDLDGLAEAAAGCRGCALYEQATQTVFGAGAHDARVMLVGEQPGDQEDRQGTPFVGPAGRLLDRALGEAGLDRSSLWLTNAVKHFKFTETERPRKRRMHEAPSMGEVAACRPWLEEELLAVGPDLVVTLGATAGRALLGPGFRVGADRGREVPAVVEGRREEGGEPWRGLVLTTIHPSAALRAGPDRERVYAGLVEDLARAASLLAKLDEPSRRRPTHGRKPR